MQRRKKQAGLGKKLKKRIFTPTGRRKKQAGLGEKLKKEELLQQKEIKYQK